MLGLSWLRGLATRRWGHLVATAGGVAIAVSLLASLAIFVTAAKATMTARAVSDLPVDWQVAIAAGADPGAALATINATAGVTAAAPVGIATTTGLVATTGATTQTTGAGVVLGLPPGYPDAFPGEIRLLTGTTVVVAGLAFGAIAGWALAEMLVRALTGVFDPAPAAIAVPWRYLAALAASAATATAVAAAATVRVGRHRLPATMRDL